MDFYWFNYFNQERISKIIKKECENIKIPKKNRLKMEEEKKKKKKDTFRGTKAEQYQLWRADIKKPFTKKKEKKGNE
jgi:hypothetical protein